MGKYLGEEMKVLCAPGVSPDAKVTARRVARSIAAALLVVPVAAAYLGANASASGLSTTSGKTVSKRPTGALKLPASKLKTVGKTKCGQVKSLWLAGEPLKGGYFISFDQQSKNYSALAKKVKKNQHKKRADYLKQSKSFASKAKAGRTACNKKAPTPITPVPTPKGPTSALKGALGVGVSSSANATRLPSARASAANSNLLALLPDGSLTDAFGERPPGFGTINVDKVLVGPDNAVYLKFVQGEYLEWKLGVPNSKCYLARVDRESGAPTCIETDTSFSMWGTFGAQYDIQFDDAGAIYYTGIELCADPTNGCAKELRRWKDGSITRVAGGPGTDITNFVVLGNGTVLFGDYKLGLLKAKQSGSTWNSSSVFDDHRLASFGLGLLPGGDGYIAQSHVGTSNVSTYRFMAAQDQLEGGGASPIPWIGKVSPEELQSGTTAPVHTLWNSPFNCTNVTSPLPDNRSPVCDGVLISRLWSSGKGINDSAYQLIARSPTSGKIFKIYPDLGLIPVPTGYTLGYTPFFFDALGDKLVITGKNAADQFVTWIHNTSDNSDLDVISASDQYQLSGLVASTVQHRVYFQALKVADNTMHNGYIDLVTSRAVITQASTSKIDDLQLFH